MGGVGGLPGLAHQGPVFRDHGRCPSGRIHRQRIGRPDPRGRATGHGGDLHTGRRQHGRGPRPDRSLRYGWRSARGRSLAEVLTRALHQRRECRRPSDRRGRRIMPDRRSAQPKQPVVRRRRYRRVVRLARTAAGVAESRQPLPNRRDREVETGSINRARRCGDAADRPRPRADVSGHERRRSSGVHVAARVGRRGHPPDGSRAGCRGRSASVDRLCLDVRRQQADPLCVVAADEAAEAARHLNHLQVGRPQARLLQQDDDAGADGRGCELQLADVSLRERQRRTAARRLVQQESRLAVVVHEHALAERRGQARGQFIRRQQPADIRNHADAKQFGHQVYQAAAAKADGRRVADDAKLHVAVQHDLLDGPAGGTHAARNPRALERRPRGRRCRVQLAIDRQHDLAVGADIDHERRAFLVQQPSTDLFVWLAVMIIP